MFWITYCVFTGILSIHFARELAQEDPLSLQFYDGFEAYGPEFGLISSATARARASHDEL